MSSAKFNLVIRGYHVYQDVWKAKLGDELIFKCDMTNRFDKYAVKAVFNHSVVGHVPRDISKVCFYFIKGGGTIQGKVIGKRQNRGKGLEIPVTYEFVGREKRIQKLTDLLKSHV